MSQRRLFSPQIVESDAFLDMPLSSQALYFHLGMMADDDGFVGNSKRIMRMIGANEDDLKLLSVKRFVLTFPNGIIVIKHWNINNWIRPDRYKPTQYIEEKNSLILKENGSYTEKNAPDNQMTTIGMSSGMPQVKVSKGKISKDKVSIEREGIALTPSQKARQFFSDSSKQEEVAQALIAKGVPRNSALTELAKFISYWTELNKSGTKQRWELQETFQLERRLTTWFSKIRDFKKSESTMAII